MPSQSDEIERKLDILARRLDHVIARESGLEIKRVVFVRQRRILFYSDESKHRGRPHCIVELSRDHRPKIDIATGDVIEGDAGPYWRHLRRFVADEDVRRQLLDIWDETRPDDQRLPSGDDPTLR